LKKKHKTVGREKRLWTLFIGLYKKDAFLEEEEEYFLVQLEYDAVV
jgi:hypothetical protein